MLSAVPYQANRVILHRDANLMPVRKRVWASWNYLRNSKTENEKRVAVSYWMNRLQGIDPKYPLFVTLNPEREPDPKLVFAEFSYDHPQFSGTSVVAQRELATIQGQNNTWYAGCLDWIWLPRRRALFRIGCGRSTWWHHSMASIATRLCRGGRMTTPEYACRSTLACTGSSSIALCGRCDASEDETGRTPFHLSGVLDC